MARGPAGLSSAATSANRRIVIGRPLQTALFCRLGRRSSDGRDRRALRGPRRSRPSDDLLPRRQNSGVATLRVPGTGKSRRRRAQQTRTFGTTIAQLEQLGDWLEGFAVTLVGMEATGVYWKPVFSVLERRFECWLINAEHLHNVPGRKSDVIDSRWLCELLELGLVRPSFVPPPEIRRLRDLTRLRSTQAEERTRAIQRLEKVLQDAGIKLGSVASKTYSVSARAMLEALLGGVSDPACLADLAKGRLRTKIPQLTEALANRFDTAHHGVLVAGLLAHVDALDQAVVPVAAHVPPGTA